MSSVSVFVGMDYHQSSVQVCVLDRSGKVLSNRSVANDRETILEFVRQHGRVAEAAMEACVGAANLAEELMVHGGWQVHLAHPGYVNRMRQNPDKHDDGDAHLLADLVRVGYLPRVWLAPHDVRELRRLMQYRQQLVRERRNIKLRMGAMLRDQRQSPPGSLWTIKGHAWLEKAQLTPQSRWIIERLDARLNALYEEIGAVEERLEELTGNDPIVKRLLTYKGIGRVTAWMLRAYIGRFDRFRTGKQLARFCGLSPRNASSGQRQADAGMIKAGNPDLRAALIEAGHRLVRFEPRWQELAVAMHGKPKCVIIAAVANRWVRWLFHQMKATEQAA